ncbi:MAG: toll/interleukin-1 receptor domain-containing protein [Sterolibacteriaceae bacterium MAG5]|nr:toll/interleukin-1 receptor domain-containing protein [Candidatus Nitricoxidireducens bremensis]
MTQPPAQPFKLFISYSHRNEACKDRLKINLAPLVRNKWVELWDDRAIPAGADWRQHIEDAMQTADAAVFLIDDDFLASDFCMDVEIATFLQNHRELGTLIIFVITDHCGWQDFDFISRFKVIPLDGRPITAHKPYSKAYTHIKDEIRNSLAAHQPKPPPIDESPLVPAAFALGGAIDAVTAFDDLRLSNIPAGKTSPPLSRGALLERLPGRSSHLFGREDELTKLDTWRRHKGVFLWIADGGMGKSTLTRWWLEKQDWPEGTRFLGHSFYRQGSRNEAASARGFLIEALANLHIEHAENAPDEELGRKLAEEIAKAPTVLVLDGIEPTQQAAEASPHHGSIRDPGLATLIGTLARQPGQALCLATSRIPVTDTTIRNAPGFREEVLHILLPAAALALLRQRGIAGSDTELGAMAERCGHQPLALVLGAEFSHTFLQGKAAAFLERPWQPKAGDTHAVTVMGWFDQALAEEHQALDRELSLILGLFDRPAPWGALMAMKAHEPAIPGLTERLHKADDAAIFESLARLSQWGLLETDLTQAEPELDAHPLVREHFGKQLEGSSLEACRAAHGVLFDWFQRLPEKEFPDTLEEMEPLYRAVRHGCLAGLYSDAAANVFRRRIRRGGRSYSINKLGAFAAELDAFAHFFEKPWQQPASVLGDEDRGWLFHASAFCLRAIGQLTEAIDPFQAGIRISLSQGNWKNIVIAYENICELQLALGQIQDAISTAGVAVAHAERSKDIHAKVISYSVLAAALHQSGETESALMLFGEAEAMQAKLPPHYYFLYSLRGFQYCDAMLSSAEIAAWRGVGTSSAIKRCAEVSKRASQTLTWGRKADSSLLIWALDQLIIAQCALYQSKLNGQQPSLDAESKTEATVSTLRASGNKMYLPQGLLTRAWLRHSQGDIYGSQADLDEAQQVAERGSMKLYLADIALTRARLFKDRGELAKARALIEECGYGRRLPELADAEAAAKDWPA